MLTIIVALLLALLLSPVAPAEAPNAVFDLAGRPVHPLDDSAARGVVLVFVRTDCPLSNRYAPVLNALYDKYSALGISFWLIYVDPHQSRDQVRHYAAGYGYRARVAIDPRHLLVHTSGARVTPEAVVFVHHVLVYRGRIDNRYPELGLSLPRPTRSDLNLTLSAIVSHHPVPEKTTRAIGCFISDLE